MKTFFVRLKDSFVWSNWEEIGEQCDNYAKELFVIMRRKNKNGLLEFKKVVKTTSQFYTKDLHIE